MSCSTALRLQPVFLTTRLFRPRAALVLPSHVLLRHASSSKAHITEKPRILEKPARFNPPSHASHAPRRARPRAYGAPLSDAERDAQAEKRYPNMMPPEGSFMHRVLTNRTLHLWITLGVLVTMAGYSMSLSFLSTTAYRSLLPSSADFFAHPLTSARQLIAVYKLHVAHESEKTAEKRRRRLDDVKKREEFMRAHGVEPGFLTGGWMDKFGTVEGDLAKKRREEEGGASAVAAAAAAQEESPVAAATTAVSAMAAQGTGSVQEGEESVDWKGQREERRRPKMWLGIW